MTIIVIDPNKRRVYSSTQKYEVIHKAVKEYEDKHGVSCMDFVIITEQNSTVIIEVPEVRIEGAPVKAEGVNEWRTFVIAKCKKEVQDIKLADGSIHLQCWPNAGYFIHLIDGRAKDVPQTEVIETRKCKIQLFGYEQKK